MYGNLYALLQPLILVHKEGQKFGGSVPRPISATARVPSRLLCSQVSLSIPMLSELTDIAGLCMCLHVICLTEYLGSLDPHNSIH